MKYYFAPMEGITGYIHRNAHHALFGGADKYFTPFLSPNQNRKFTSRELNDVLPEHNKDLLVVPQLLTNKADDFIWAAGELKKLGYEEVNLNLGCPSKTVVTKQKGAGFLAKQIELDLFLGKVISEIDMKLSLKIRLGMDSPEEFYQLIDIFNQYPLEELIIHPRAQSGGYKKDKLNLEVFRDALSLSSNPVCYNGDLFTASDFSHLTGLMPDIEKVMLGRGLVSNPGLIREIEKGTELDKRQLRKFHDTVYRGYANILYGDRNILFHMKELWLYMICMFEDNEKFVKKIKKSQRLEDYEEAVSGLFEQLEIRKGSGYAAL